MTVLIILKPLLPFSSGTNEIKTQTGGKEMELYCILILTKQWNIDKTALSAKERR